jgi:transcriptional regulator with XRE-family HTH domain
MDWKTLGQTIKSHRTTRKIGGRKVTQQQLAGAAGVTHQMISALEKGDTGASLEVLEGIASALGGELVVDFKFPEGPPDPIGDQIRAALPRLPERALRALLSQIEALDSIRDAADKP